MKQSVTGVCDMAQSIDAIAEKPLTAAGEHHRLFPLVPFSPEQAFETYYFEIDPGTVFHGEPHQGNVQEYLFVTRGSLRLSLGGEGLPDQRRGVSAFRGQRPPRL